jgi:uncharacterized protein (DUF1015 family)
MNPILPGGNGPRLLVLLTCVSILPSSQAAKAPGLVLAPFRGVRYAEGRVSGLAEVTSPPYDVIAADTETQLMASDPHNVVRLILPRHESGKPGSPYDDAAADLARWLADGILVADNEPALYVYEQAAGEPGGPGGPAGPGASGGPGGPGGRGGPGQAGGPAVVQRGLIGALSLSPPSAGIVLPHENVAAGPVAGRRQLMEATQANLEPIFLLYDGGNGSSGALITDVATGQRPIAEAWTPDGMRHRLWAIADPGQLATVAEDLAPRTALIADGHHRYAAYRQLQDRMRAAGPGPWDAGLALLVDSAAYPPRLGAIHRLIVGMLPEVAAKLAAAAFCVRELPGGSADLDGALAELADACTRGVAFLLTGAGQAYLLSDPDPGLLRSAVPDEPADLWQRLPGAVLDGLLLPRLWGIDDDDRSVQAVHDAAAAVRASESSGTAVVCCPMSAEQVYRVAAMGRRVPRKSTSFGPKPRTGLVMRLFAEG